MILPGGANTDTLHSLNGLAQLGEMIDLTGHYVDPLRWRNGIHGLGDLGYFIPDTQFPVCPSPPMQLTGAPGGWNCDYATSSSPPSPHHKGLFGLGVAHSLTPGLNGLADLGCGNSILDCACKCGPGQSDHALAPGLSGLGDASTDMTLGGFDLTTALASMGWMGYAALAIGAYMMFFSPSAKARSGRIKSAKQKAREMVRAARAS